MIWAEIFLLELSINFNAIMLHELNFSYLCINVAYKSNTYEKDHIARPFFGTIINSL
jgi:hypothetical protein